MNEMYLPFSHECLDLGCAGFLVSVKLVLGVLIPDGSEVCGEAAVQAEDLPVQGLDLPHMSD